MCQIQKTKIEVRGDFVIYADACKAGQLEVKDRRDNWSDVVDNDRKAEIYSLNVGLVRFIIQTQTSLANSIRKTRCK